MGELGESFDLHQGFRSASENILVGRFIQIESVQKCLLRFRIQWCFAGSGGMCSSVRQGDQGGELWFWCEFGRMMILHRFNNMRGQIPFVQKEPWRSVSAES